ncbi:hypothetical protein BGZ46_004409, partial [Entomortierella lignicola]
DNEEIEDGGDTEPVGEIGEDVDIEVVGECGLEEDDEEDDDEEEDDEDDDDEEEEVVAGEDELMEIDGKKYEVGLSSSEDP